MKQLALLLLLTITNTVFGKTYFINREVLLRIPDTQKTHIQLRKLDGLTNKFAYESDHFKIVLKKSNDPIRFDNPDEDIQLRAATVYYHLNQARKYWVDELKSEMAKNLHKMTIRLEITNSFSDIAHFMSDKMDPEYNNALSIPAGTPPDFVPDGKPWEQEIWFRPKKTISTRDLDVNIGANPLTTQLQALQGPIQDFALGQFRSDIISALFWDRYKGPLWKDALWTGGTFAVMKVIMEGSKKMDRFFLSKWYYLDTALVPEVIFHEYAHIILSDKLSISHSTAVVEGMADYFAATIASNYLIYGGVPGRSNAKAKDGLNKNPYRHFMEHNSQATADFVLSVLWKVRLEFPDKANILIYNARNYLKTESASIYDSFLRALLRSCNDVCDRPFRDRNRLYQVFTKKGL